MRNAYGSVARKPEEKRPLGILGHRWEDNIKMRLRTEIIRLRVGRGRLL
jgi:hypothetical protein